MSTRTRPRHDPRKMVAPADPARPLACNFCRLAPKPEEVKTLEWQYPGPGGGLVKSVVWECSRCGWENKHGVA